ncbi:hypothetical protein BS50DRAFT_650838 [Corynespora cassiicola Philippines]|uniref:Uncharacterized protein n=1 Tax=Corynespora cassiicola Philippines TaxID=1448308 RepID=A0A2T2NB70_CORCC|nr:hypothetical protein BS50DRAFT_650838 [Corynespora cassiicola Philippines]
MAQNTSFTSIMGESGFLSFDTRDCSEALESPFSPNFNPNLFSNYVLPENTEGGGILPLDTHTEPPLGPHISNAFFHQCQLPELTMVGDCLDLFDAESNLPLDPRLVTIPFHASGVAPEIEHDNKTSDHDLSDDSGVKLESSDMTEELQSDITLKPDHNGRIKLAFTNDPLAARRYRSHVSRKPYIDPKADHTIREVMRHEEYWVEQLVMAMLNTYQVKDRKESGDVDFFTSILSEESKKKLSNNRKNAECDLLRLEANCRAVLGAILELCIFGFRGLASEDYTVKFKTLKSVFEEDSKVNCEERLHNTCQFDKRVARDVYVGEDVKIRILVNAPLAYAQRKIDYNRNNDTRAKTYAASKAAVKGEDTEMQATPQQGLAEADEMIERTEGTEGTEEDEGQEGVHNPWPTSEDLKMLLKLLPVKNMLRTLEVGRPQVFSALEAESRRERKPLAPKIRSESGRKKPQTNKAAKEPVRKGETAPTRKRKRSEDGDDVSDCEFKPIPQKRRRGRPRKTK